MIDYQPVKVLVTIGHIKIYSYGFMLSMAFFAGYMVAHKEIKRRGLAVDEFHIMFILIVVGALLGSRVYYVLEHFKYYFANPAEIMSSWKGGVSSFGGYIGSFALSFVYMKYKRLAFMEYVDALLPSLCLGIFLTRIGCFLNWDDYGIASTLPWAVNAGDFPRHPTQLYLSLNGLVLFAVFFRLRSRFSRPGRLFLTFLAAYTPIRFFIEFLRDEPRHLWNLTLAQFFCAGLLVVAVMCLGLQRPVTGRS